MPPPPKTSDPSPFTLSEPPGNASYTPKTFDVHVTAGSQDPMQTTRSSVSRQSWRARSKQAPPSAPKADRRCPSWLIGRSVQRRRWDDPEVEAFLQRREPVVLTGGCPLVQPLVGKWTLLIIWPTHSASAALSTSTLHLKRRLRSRACTARALAKVDARPCPLPTSSSSARAVQRVFKQTSVQLRLLQRSQQHRPRKFRRHCATICRHP